MRLLVVFYFLFNGLIVSAKELSKMGKMAEENMAMMNKFLTKNEENKSYYENSIIPCMSMLEDCLQKVPSEIAYLGHSLISVQEYILSMSSPLEKRKKAQVFSLSGLKNPVDNESEQLLEMKVFVNLIKKGLQDCKTNPIDTISRLKPINTFVKEKSPEMIVFGENHARNYFDTDIILSLASDQLAQGKKPTFYLENIGTHNQKLVNDYISGKLSWELFIEEYVTDVDIHPGSKEKKIMDYAKENNLKVFAFDNKQEIDEEYEEKYGREAWLEARDIFMTNFVEKHSLDKKEVPFMLIGENHIQGQRKIHESKGQNNILYMLPTFVSDSDSSKAINIDDKTYLYTVPVVDKYRFNYGNSHIIEK